MPTDTPGQPKRPAHRNYTLSFRVPAAIHAEALKRAKREGRSLSAILRAWLIEWTAGEASSPPALPDETVRAPKLPRPPKK